MLCRSTSSYSGYKYASGSGRIDLVEIQPLIEEGLDEALKLWIIKHPINLSFSKCHWFGQQHLLQQVGLIHHPECSAKGSKTSEPARSRSFNRPGPPDR